MQPTKTLRLLLVTSGLIAVYIGASILLAPARFHASNGIELVADASLLSEVRAPGGALLALGLLMGIGVFVERFTLASTSIAAAVYLAYGGSRLLSIGLDGVPAAGLFGATVIELGLGAACAVALVRATQPQRARRAARGEPWRGRRSTLCPSSPERSTTTAVALAGVDRRHSASGAQ